MNTAKPVQILGGAPERDEWHAFLEQMPGSTVYHSPEFADCLRLAGIECVILHARDKGDHLAGLALIILDRLAPIPVIGCKAFAPAGLLARDEATHRSLLKASDRRLRRRSLYFELFQNDDDAGSQLARAGFREDRHCNFLLDLDGETGSFRKRYSRSIRRNIRKAEARGIHWRHVRNLADLKIMDGLLNETCQRVEAPCLPWRLLKAVYHILVPRGMARMYLAFLPKGEASIPINARIELIFKGRSIDWYTGAAEEWIESQAGTWLVDRILEDLQKHGVHCFDFGGGGRVGEDYGPAEFKRRFGGREIEVIRFQKVYHPVLTGLARRAWGLLHGDQRRVADSES